MMQTTYLENKKIYKDIEIKVIRKVIRPTITCLDTVEMRLLRCIESKIG